jgi:prepilin-type N-terminal cleavage/methylation domain-containing protein
MKKTVRRGFTLPEILVTVTVVAVLAAVVVPAVTQFINKGDAPATSSDIDQVRSAITGYVTDTRSYPKTFSDLISNDDNATNFKGPYFTGQLSGVSGVSATFISNGANISLGPDITHTGSYLTTLVAFTSGTCTALYNLDKIIDGTTGDGANGNLTWTGCATSTTTFDASAITLKLTNVGS